LKDKQTYDSTSAGKGKRRLLNRIRRLVIEQPAARLHAAQNNRRQQIFRFRFDPTDAAERIADISTALKSTSKEVEPKFIELGDDLQTVFFDTNALLEQISEKVNMFSEHSEDSLLVQVRGHVENCLKELRKIRREVDQKTDHIKMLVDYLGRLHKKCTAFEQTTMFIRVVGLNVGIESTRSAESSQMFSVVAEEIRRVSEKVTDTTKAILADAGTEQAMQAAMSRDMSKGNNHLAGLAQDGEKTVRQALRHIEQLIETSLQMLENAGSHAEVISRQVGEVVQAIQFHDNMSQRLEHMSDAFEDVKKHCLREDIAGDPGEDRSTRFASAHSILEIQEAQLKRVIADIDRVHLTILGAFDMIKSKVADLAIILPSFGSNSDNNGMVGKNSVPDPISALKSALVQLQTIQNQGRQLVERMIATTSQTSETVNNLSNHTKRVRSLSQDTHIMALNAIVKAAHLGENGAPHEVLAQEVKSLSKHTDMFVEDVESVIGKISHHAQGLLSGWNINENDDSSRGHAEEMLSIGVQEITSAYGNFLEDTADTVECAKALEAAIVQAGNGLSFIPILVQQLEDHLKAVSEVRQVFMPWEDKGRDSSPAGSKALAERYTMLEERQIHEQAIGANEDALELFGEDPPADNPEMTQNEPQGSEDFKPDTDAGEDDLGDNVELF